MQNKLLKSITTILLSLILTITIYTYFSSLGQYATADQMQFTMARFRNFQTDYNTITPADGSNLSFILVYFPGHILENILKSNYSINEKIIGNFRYTEVFPYLFFQVAWSLAILFLCIYFLIGILNLKIKNNLPVFLFIAILLLNYPIFKGDIKVLKYDALSLTFTLLGLLSYILFKTNLKTKYLIFSFVFSSFAFLEKDVSLFGLLTILMAEMFFISKQNKSPQEIVKQLFILLLIVIGILISTTYILTPQFWLNPSLLPSIFDGFSFYLQAVKPVYILLFIGFLFVGFAIQRLYIAKELAIKIWIKNNAFTKKALLIFSVISIALFTSTILYQANNMVCFSYVNPDLRSKIISENIYTTPEMAQTSISTLDESALLTRIKISYNIFRIIIYSLPELITFIVFFSPLILLLLKRKMCIFNTIEYTPFLVLLWFIAAYFSSFFLLMPPVDFKYTIPMNLLLFIFAILLVVKFISIKKIRNWNYILMIVFSVLMIRPMLAANPTHLGYMSIFRNTTYENNDFLDMNKYSAWTWLGWGEASYSAFRNVENKNMKKNKLLLDYLPPFAFDSSKVEIVYNAHARDRYNEFGSKEFKNFLTQIQHAGIDYIIVSKNVAFRGTIGNYTVLHYRNKAEYIDKVCGVEYAWLFNVTTLNKYCAK